MNGMTCWVVSIITLIATETAVGQNPLPPADSADIIGVVDRFNAALTAREGDGLASLFDESGDAYLADGRTILHGDGLRRLASADFEPAGLQRRIVRIAFLASDVALVQQRASRANEEGHVRQESLLLANRGGEWRINHFQTTGHAAWAGPFIAEHDSEPPPEKRPEILPPEIDGPGLAEVSADSRAQIRAGCEARLREKATSYGKADADLYANSFTETGAVMPAGGNGIVKGRDSIRTVIAAAFEGPFKGIRVTSKIAELKVLGPRIATARIEGEIRMADGSEYPFPPFREPGHQYRIFVLEDDGEWRMRLQHNTPVELVE